MARRRSQSSTRPVKPRKPVPLTKNGFTYDDDGLTAFAFQWNSLEQIKNILFSDNLTTAVRNNTVELPNKERGKGYKPWVSAQLSHYGIPFASDEATAKLKKKLIEAVDSGKCDQVPDSVLALKSELSDTWKSKLKDYDEKLTVWNEDNEKRKDEAFQQLDSPLEQAKYDAVRFVSKYFQDSQGRSDPTKTPETMILPGLSAKAREDIGAEADKLGDLYTAGRWVYTFEDANFVIGWNQDVVKNTAKALEKEECRKLDERQEQMEKPLLELHKNLKHDAESRSNFSLNNIVGAYMVKCKEIESEWSEEGILQLSIESGGHATFNFRVLEGAMYLSKSKPLIEYDSDSSNEDQEDSDGESPEADQDEDSGDSGTALLSRKRKAPDESNGHSAKRRDTADEKSRKIYFTWSGQETGEGEEQENGNGFYNTGCLAFDRTLTAFKGTMNIGFVGEDCVLSGFKTSHTPGRTPSTVWGGFL